MKSQDHELRLTDTNSANDSEGRTWGLEGNLFWYLVGGGFVFVITLLLLFSVGQMAFTKALVLASIPLLLTLIYVFALRQGRPPAYDIDLIDTFWNGEGFAPHPIQPADHPLSATEIEP